MEQNPRMFGGFYQVGQAITSGPLLTVYSAYNRYSSDVVGLYVVELPPTVNEEAAEGLLQVFEQRRRVQSPHVIHVYDWGVDGASVYIATDPPRGLTLRHVLDGENLDLRRALDLARQMARGLAAFQEQGMVNIDMRPQLITVDILEESYRAQLDDIGLRAFLKQLGYVSSQREIMKHPRPCKTWLNAPWRKIQRSASPTPPRSCKHWRACPSPANHLSPRKIFRSHPPKNHSLPWRR